MILKILAELGKARESEIAKRAPHFSIATVHENLEKALLMGLVAREGRYYILTDKGREFLKSAIEEIKRFVEGAEKVEERF
jgi:predicted transcriptional regulator